MTDEDQIRALIQSWMDASRAGDTAAVLDLMTDDVVFMVPGREPFGKEVFAAQSQAMSDIGVDGRGDILEIQLLGDWAWIRSHLDLTITPPIGAPVHHAGYTLTILRKENGRWRLARDANLVTAVA